MEKMKMEKSFEMGGKVSDEAMAAIYEAVVQFFVSKGEEDAYVRENCWLQPKFQWDASVYDAINSEGLMYEWAILICADKKVREVAARFNVLLEPYFSWSLGMYPND